MPQPTDTQAANSDTGTATVEKKTSIRTSDVGYFIRDHIDSRDIEIVDSNLPPDEWSFISSIDDSDPSNLVCRFSNGQTFTVRIVATG